MHILLHALSFFHVSLY